MSLPTTISARFDIVTPMFLGDARQEVTRIREASIKGALAFWWRALNYAGYVRDHDGEQKEALRAMQGDEQRLFGGATAGQGAFLLKVTEGPGAGDVIEKGQVLARDWTGFLRPKRNDPRLLCEGARYLGYGVINAFHTNARDDKPEMQPGELLRSCFAKGQSFEVQFIRRPGGVDEDWRAVKEATKAFGLLGGLGTRKRRGFGSVALVSMKENGADIWGPPTSRHAYCEKLREVLGGALPAVVGVDFSLTAFARESDVRVGEITEGNALAVLGKLGDALLKYRARGRPRGCYGSIAVDAAFADDHDWFKQEGAFADGRGNYIPERTSFGLPHNYSKHFGVNATGGLDRRASPLMFHIHKAGNTAFAVAMLFPVRFLPEDEAAVWQNTPANKTPHAYAFNAEVLSDFLDGRTHGGEMNQSEYFPNTRLFP